MIINTEPNNKRKTNYKSKGFITYEEKQSTLKLIGIAIIILIILLIIRGVSSSRSNYRYLKENKNEYLVYTVYVDEYTKAPHINVKGQEINNLNKEITNYIDNMEGKFTTEYKYNISGDYLSVVIEITKEEDTPEKIFKTYNINLKRKEILNDTQILTLYHLMDTEVSDKIENKFKEYYKDEVKKGYIVEEECDFDCYLYHRNIDNYLDNINYYINGEKLLVYKSFNYVSILDDSDYFNKESFIFEVN